MKRIVLLLIFTVSVNAVNSGGLSGLFLRYSLSARDLAMGRSYTTLSTDAGAAYWNPAAASWSRNNELQISCSRLYSGTVDNSVSGILPLRKAGFAFSFLQRELDDFEKRDTNNQPGGELKLLENAFLLSYSYCYENSFSWGIGIKTIYQNIAGFKDRGLGMDTGILFVPRAIPLLRVGITVKNIIGPRLTLDRDEERFPVEKRLGFGLVVDSFKASVDFQQVENSSIEYFLGLAYTPIDVLTLRIGMNENEITAGMGIGGSRWKIDYAYAVHQYLNSVYKFSLSYLFGPKEGKIKPKSLRHKKAKRELLEETVKEIQTKVSILESEISRLMESFSEITEKQTKVSDKALEEKKSEEKETVVKSSSSLKIDVIITRGISGRWPVDEGLEFSKNIGKLYCWTLVHTEKYPTEIKHIWYFENKKMAEVPLIIKNRWYRVYSSKIILPDWSGQWYIEIVDENNNVIKRVNFSIQ